MMSTILTLMVTAMVFQAVVAVLDSVLDTVGVNAMLRGLPIVGANLTLIYAYLIVSISGLGDGEHAYNSGLELLKLGDFGTDLGVAMVIVAFIPVKDAAISALGKGISRG